MAIYNIIVNKADMCCCCCMLFPRAYNMAGCRDIHRYAPVDSTDSELL